LERSPGSDSPISPTIHSGCAARLQDDIEKPIWLFWLPGVFSTAKRPAQDRGGEVLRRRLAGGARDRRQPESHRASFADASAAAPRPASATSAAGSPAAGPSAGARQRGPRAAAAGAWTRNRGRRRARRGSRRRGRPPAPSASRPRRRSGTASPSSRAPSGGERRRA
jgi:hypothetical protein